MFFKRNRPFSRIASALLAVICILHVVRVAMALPVTVGHTAIPLWMSIAAAIFTGGLAVMLFRES